MAEIAVKGGFVYKENENTDRLNMIFQKTFNGSLKLLSGNS